MSCPGSKTDALVPAEVEIGTGPRETKVLVLPLVFAVLDKLSMRLCIDNTINEEVDNN